MDIIAIISKELGIKNTQTEAAVNLIDEGNTIPFISRYRKEATGALNDEQLRELDVRLKYLRSLEERKEAVQNSIEEQGKLTDELREKIMQAMTLVEVEDLYLPYKQKRKTRAGIARERGLEPLAMLILSGKKNASLEEEASVFVDAEQEVPDAQAALAGACDIIAEMISNTANYRSHIRLETWNDGLLTSKAKDKAVAEKRGEKRTEEQGTAVSGEEAEAKATQKSEKMTDKVKDRKDSGVYEMYYDYAEPVKKVAPHRVLALNRGEAEKILVVKIEAPVETIGRYLETQVIKEKTLDEIQKESHYDEETKALLSEVCTDAYNRLIAPAIERDVRNELTEKAQDGAITLFGKNLAQLLMQPPIAGKTVLGWDPAFRTGCKIAIVDPTGKVLDTTVVYPTAPQNKVKETKDEIVKLIKKYGIDLISLGNGTASRESEQIIAEMIKEAGLSVQYVIVNEAGASVYSASKLATEEFPNFDVGQRSATSMARRLQDPLAELVKIDPQSIGVGQYQHDCDQKKLSEALTGVVEDCVNKVGVDLNTASAALLQYISGINKTIAKNIVTYREENGQFASRAALKKVPKLGPKAFEQCAGFLRINGGKEPLDATSVHPESYTAAKMLMEELGISLKDRGKEKAETKQEQALKTIATAEKAGPKESQNKSDVFARRPVATGPMAEALKAAGLLGSASLAQTKPQPVKVKENAAPSLLKKIADPKALAEKLGIGEITLTDIVSELEKPSRDPRESLPSPILKSDVLDISDLKEGMILKGTVRNVIDFGAFVDIGVHQDGLVHISQIADRFVKHPLDVVSVGDVVKVKVLSVDPAKKRIALTMKNIE